MCTQGPDHVEALVFQGTRRGRPIKTFTEAISQIEPSGNKKPKLTKVTLYGSD